MIGLGYDGEIEEVAFILGDFGEQAEEDCRNIAKSIGAKGTIYHQDQPLGTAHAILCAKESLSGNCFVAFADTLFKADFVFDPQEDGLIWAKRVEDPSAYGVLKLDEAGYITDFVEKPTTFVSDLAIVGIYYFKDGENLKSELQYLIDNNIMEKGEYQLTNALENMKAKGLKFKPGEIEEWLDCGNKTAVVHANQRVLELQQKKEKLVADSVKMENSVIIQPCFIGENVELKNTIVGPHVSIGANSTIENSVVKNSLIQNDSHVKSVILENSMLGNKVTCNGTVSELSIGDYTNQSI